MGETTGQAAVPPEPGSGFEKTILEKGWATPDQVAAGHKHQAERKAAGESLTFPQAMIAINALTKDQVREALGKQDKASMRCPTCRKVYTIWGYKPGSKTTCKTCKVALIPTGDTAAAILKETATATAAALLATPVPAPAIAPPAAAPAAEAIPVIPVAPLAPVAPAVATSATSAASEITDKIAILPVGVTAAPAAPPLDPALVNLVAGYKIERCVGSGAMGDVYLAQQTSMERPVALKLLPPELAKNQEFVTRFISEARAAGKLSHENIVQAVDVGESNGRYYFVMEYVNGQTLQDCLKRDGKLPEKRALDIARQVAHGLRHAHAHGFIHRDIKPANIMIASEKVAKICDFGLARQVDSDVTLTIPGTVQSSPAYASPEQCRGRRDLDHRTDMYSLGVTLFEMLAGRRPFLADNPGALFIKHATEAPPSPQSLNSSITAAANQLVLRLLKKEPKQRFDTYDQLIEAIDAVQNPKKLSPMKNTRRVPGKPAPKWKAPLVGLVAASVLIGGAAFLYVQLKKSPPPAQPSGKDSQAKAGALDPEVEKLLKSMAAMETRAADEPAQIPAVRARWKELGDQFKGTPSVATIARRQQDFEARVADLAAAAASKRMAEAVELANGGRLADGLKMLRDYPSVFENTPAAERVTAQMAEIERVLDDKYRQERERLLGLLAAGKVDEARAALAPLKALVSVTDAEGRSEFVRGDLGSEVAQLTARVDELAKGDKPAPVSLPGKPEGQALIVGKSAPVEKGPPPPTPDFVLTLRTPALRADPGARTRSAINFKGLAARSAVCRAAEVFLMHDDKFWKVADASPMTKVLNDYLATLPLERADTMSTAEHTGFFITLAKKISELGDATPKDVLYLFLMGHADDLLAQNVRPDGEGLRLAKLQGAKAADFWGQPATVNRLALARLVTNGQATAVDLRRAIDPISADVAFQSRLLCALALLRDKDFDPVTAAASWKRLAGMVPESSAGKWCDEVSDRLKKASICDGCNGVGKYACKKCMAAGMADCDKCKGSGRVPETAEPGFVSRYTVPCPICKQKGKVICPICQGGRVQKCEKCDGKKVRKTVSGSEYVDVVESRLCAPCGGTGNIFPRVAFPCPDCDGVGRAFPR